MTYYAVIVIDLCSYEILYKSRPTRSKVKAQRIFDRKADGDGEDLNPPNGFLPLLLSFSVDVDEPKRCRKCNGIISDILKLREYRDSALCSCEDS